MSANELETETKYEAPDDVMVPALDGLPGVASVLAEDEQLDAEYFDTADLTLLRAGVTLRRRTGGHDAGWHLKLPAGPQTREEIRRPAGRPGCPVPDELADLVLARTRGAPLVPVATIHTRRRRSQLLSDSGQPLAEVADDRISAGRHQDPSALISWREVEVELAGSDHGLLNAADQLLRDHGLAPSSRSAKLERVLAEQLPDRRVPVPLTGDSPAYQVVLSYLAEHAESLVAIDPQVRRSAPDAVHQMRVATRRLRSTLRSFDEVVAGDRAAWVAGELKWLSDLLGRARDAEVLAAHLQRHQDRTDIALLLGPVQARIQAYLARSRATAQADVSAALRSGRYTALLAELDRLLAEPPLGPAAGQPASEAIPFAVRHSYRTTSRRMRRASRQPAGPGRDMALHQARKAAKRTRYAAEAALPVSGAAARRLARRVKKVQSVLGDHQDTVVARALERRLGIAAYQAGENAFSYGLFYERDVCDARLLDSRAASAWRRASQRRLRHWLTVSR